MTVILVPMNFQEQVYMNLELKHKDVLLKDGPRKDPVNVYKRNFICDVRTKGFLSVTKSKGGRSFLLREKPGGSGVSKITIK